ncbi:MAG: hypothetical protein QM715_02610 [Nibricoccus sp.]
MSRLLLLVLTHVALFWVAPCSAAEPFKSDDADVQTLVYTKFFGFGPINDKGQISEGEAALKRIVKQEGGINNLFIVFDRATLAGKCYALTGIRHLSPNSFEGFCKQLETYKSMRVKTVVETKIVQEPLADVISMIRTGLYSNYLVTE